MKRNFTLFYTTAFLLAAASVFSLVSCNFESNNTEKEESITTETASETEESSSETEDESKYSEGLEYVINSDGKSYRCLGKGSCTSSKVIIPATYNSLPVTEIGSPSSGNTIEWLGVEILIIADGERIVNRSVFSSSISIRELHVGSGVTLDDGAFMYSKELQTVYLSDNVTINDYVFKECLKLNSVYMSDKTNLKGDDVFFACINLQNVALPKHMKTLPQAAFGKCSALTNITLPEGLTKIDSGAFLKCSSLNSITFPDGLEHIGENAFNSCTALEEISLPQGVKNICYQAFISCEKLEYVYIPSSTVMIEGYVFAYTTIKQINYGGTIDQWEKINKSEYWNCDSSVEKIICSDGIIELNAEQ